MTVQRFRPTDAEAHLLNILIFDEDPLLRRRLAELLRDPECRVVAPADLDEAARAVLSEPFDVILCDYWVRNADGLVFFHLIKGQQPDAVKVLMAGYPIPATPDDIDWAGIDHVIPRSSAFKCLDLLKRELAGASPQQ
jgi:DNA-binding NarL/FixJ family response regulator